MAFAFLLPPTVFSPSLDMHVRDCGFEFPPSLLVKINFYSDSFLHCFYNVEKRRDETAGRKEERVCVCAVRKSFFFSWLNDM
jgi:hypothetical protein